MTAPSLQSVQKILKSHLFILVVLVFILSIFVSYKLYSRSHPSQPQASPKPSPLNVASTLTNIASQLPIETQAYSIKATRQGIKYRFYITQKTSSDSAIKDVEKWFKDQGVADLTQVDIVWLPAPGTLPVKTK